MDSMSRRTHRQVGIQDPFNENMFLFQSSKSGYTSKLKDCYFKLIKQIKNFKILLITTISVFVFCVFFLSNTTSFDPHYASLQLLGGGNFGDSNSTSIFKAFRESPPKLNIKKFDSIEKRFKYYFPYDNNGEIENNIIQLWKHRADSTFFPSKCFQHMERWRTANSEFNHNLLTFDEAQQQLYDHFSHEMPEIIDAYLKLPDLRLKFEFLKYLIVFVNGGVYADIDTLDAKPVKFWYQSTLKPSKFLVGINIDYNDVNWDILYNRRLTFSSKIFQSKSHHPFLAKLLSKIVYIALNNDQQIESIDWKQAYENLDSNGEPLIQYTSESIFTDTLFEYFNQLNNPVVYRIARTDKDLVPKQIFGPETTDIFNYRLFTLSKGPTQVDDIVVMPQITFRGPLTNSHKGALNTQTYEAEYDDENAKNPLYYARSLQYLSWDSFLDHE